MTSELEILHRTPQILEVNYLDRNAIVISGRPQSDDAKVRVDILTPDLSRIASVVVAKERAGAWVDRELSRYFAVAAGDGAWVPTALRGEAMGEKP